MAFKESPRFPDILARGSRFGPAYSSAVARNLGGYEVNNQNWSMPLYQGDVQPAVRTQAQLDELLAFFHGVAGRHNGFRFKDYKDYQAAGAQGTLVSLGGSTWQLYKTYTYGALTTTRKIVKPLSTVTFSGGGTYSLATATGIVTKSAGADPTAWAGEFDVPVRFDMDAMLPAWIDIEHFDFAAIPIIELRL